MPRSSDFVKIRETSAPSTTRLRETLLRRNGLPFSRRDLDSLPEQTVEEGLASLLAQGALAAYPPLVELTGHPVAQAEHTLLVTDREVVVLTA